MAKNKGKKGDGSNSRMVTTVAVTGPARGTPRIRSAGFPSTKNSTFAWVCVLALVV